MFDIKITEYDIFKAKKEANEINKGISTIGRNGTKEEQIIGNIAENKIVEILNVPKANKIIDYGYDIKINNKLIDIKCMGRKFKPKLDYVANFFPRQKNYKANFFLYTSYNKNLKILTVCGLIEKEQYFEKAKLFKKGTKRFRGQSPPLIVEDDLYELEYKYFTSIKSLQELKNKLYES